MKEFTLIENIITIILAVVTTVLIFIKWHKHEEYNSSYNEWLSEDKAKYPELYKDDK